MSNLRQACPSCGRPLELPAEATGKRAKCPACEATFVVGQSAPTVSNPYTAASGTAASTPPPARPHPASPSPASASPASASPASASPAAPNAASPPVNPYQPTQSAMATSTLAGYTIVDRSIEEIVSPTLAIFQARWQPVILSALIVLAVSIAGLAVPFGVLFALAGMANGGGGVAAGMSILGMLLLFPVLLLLSAYIMVGWSRVMLAVVRDEPSPLSQMMPPLRLVGRFLIGGLIILAGFVALMVFVGLFGWAAQAMGGGEVAFLVVNLLGTVLGTAGGFAIQFLMWPWIYVVCDDRVGSIDSLRVGFAIAMQNKVTTLLLVLCSIVLSIIGTLLCYVGQLVTIPATMLLFAVGYLLISNQPINDPRDVPSHGIAPPPQPTT